LVVPAVLAVVAWVPVELKADEKGLALIATEDEVDSEKGPLDESIWVGNANEKVGVVVGVKDG